MATGFSIGTKGYIGTGYTTAGNTKDFWEWDQVTGAWTKKADFGGVIWNNATGFSIGTSGYIGVGYFSGNGKKDLWEYTPGTPSTTAVNENEQLIHLSAFSFPNPFSTETTIKLNKEVKNVLLKIYDLSGKEISEISFSGKQITLKRENLPGGYYFYQITSEEKNLAGASLSGRQDNQVIATGKLIVQ